MKGGCLPDRALRLARASRRWYLSSSQLAPSPVSAPPPFDADRTGSTTLSGGLSVDVAGGVAAAAIGDAVASGSPSEFAICGVQGVIEQQSS